MRTTFLLTIVSIVSLAFDCVKAASNSGSSSVCGSYFPKDSSECLPSTNSTHFCCFAQTIALGIFTNMCWPISRSNYLQLDNVINIDGFSYNLDCGGFTGATCGTITVPQSYQDCAQFSTDTNSCCFYKYKNDANCVWLGTPNIGTLSYNGLEVVCVGSFVRINYFVVLLFFVFLL